MNLNCLTCQNMRRTDSEKDLMERYSPKNKPNFTLWGGVTERTWSGNLAPRPPYEKMRAGQLGLKHKKAHHRGHSTGPIEYDDGQPKLVRSCGMRRDWSFEDLRQRLKG